MRSRRSVGEGRRIALLLPDLRGGGAERASITLAGALRGLGCEIDFVLARAGGALMAEVPDGCRIVDLEVVRMRSIVPGLRRYLGCERPDGLIANMWPLTVLSCLALRSCSSRPPLVVAEHTDLRMARAIGRRQRPFLRLAGRWLYRPASAVVAVSAGVRDSLHEAAGLPQEWTRVIHNPLRQPSASGFTAEDADLARWWSEGSPRLLTVGALAPAKAHDVLLRALAGLREHPDARLVILGEGPLRAETEELVSRLGLGERVRLPGFRPDPFPFMRAADLLVLSSAWEGFGLVLIEALACGTPVVSTDCPSGPAEALDHGRFGTLAPPNDPPALAQAIKTALRAPWDAKDLESRARQFAPEEVARQYLDALFPAGAASGIETNRSLER